MRDANLACALSETVPLTHYQQCHAHCISNEPFGRLSYAAAHIVMDDRYAELPHRHEAPGIADEIASYVDWKATVAIRTKLNSFGFGIAEAMDTAQRFSIGWAIACDLIDRTAKLNLRNGFVAGAGYDQHESIGSTSELVDAVVEQADFIESRGGIVILLPMPWLTLAQADADQFDYVYREIINAVKGPIFIHWLGEAFMPTLKGYFPGDSFFDVMAIDAEKVRGVKISLLDAKAERDIRARLLQTQQIVLTGDDFNFGSLILGDDRAVQREVKIGHRAVRIGNYSHALLGILDAIAEPASIALRCLDAGDIQRYEELMMPCETLGRWIFQEPTQFYKSGLAFLSWMAGAQANPMLVNHEERSRPISYYERTAELAVRARVINDISLAESRLRALPRYLS